MTAACHMREHCDGCNGLAEATACPLGLLPASADSAALQASLCILYHEEVLDQVWCWACISFPQLGACSVAA